MASAFKTSYPKAIPCHSPEELALQNRRLNQANDELNAQARHLKERNDELAERAVRLRRWTVRMAGACVGLVLLSAGATALVIQFPSPLVPAATANQRAEAPAKESKNAAPIAVVKTNAPNEPRDPKKANVALPASAVAKPDGGPLQAGYLEALGGLSAAHLYQTHLNIGLLADGVESETYTIEDAEQNLKAVLDLMKMVDLQLTKVAKAGIDKEDQESIRDIQAIAGMLNLQIAALRAYWADGDMEQVAQYHKARKAAAQGLSKVLGIEP